MIHLGKWTISAGLRWDHYQLILNENAVSPRVSVGYYIPSWKTVLHASYDRVFQTPSFENILISSSPQIDALSSDFLRLPVQPSRGNYYEGGMTKAFADRMRLDVNVYRRYVTNYADDDQLLNTGVSYPIAFDHAIIYGAEGKLEVVRLGQLTGYISYSYMVGNVWFPVTGGLFLGDDADNALDQTTGHFPDSQDQRNTVRTRFQYQAARRIWLAAGASYGSGLPFDYHRHRGGRIGAVRPCRHQPYQLRSRTYQTPTRRLRIPGSRPVQRREYQHAPSTRRRQSEQPAERDRLRRSLLRQCHRARTQLGSASEYQLLVSYGLRACSH